MTYATSSDIQSEFKNMTFVAGQSLTDTEVDEFIAQEEAIINAVISNRYETPITGANAIILMKSISIAYVAYRVAKVLNLKKDVPIPKEMIAQSLNEGSAFFKSKKLLESIQSGKIILSDAIPRSTEQGVKSYNAENSILPLWKRDTKQW